MQPGADTPAPTRTCDHCAGTLQRRPSENRRDWEARRFCCITCRNRHVSANGRRETEGRYEDLVWLLECGESLHRIPDRLGTTPLALSRWLRRNGHPQLAARFERADVVRAA